MKNNILHCHCDMDGVICAFDDQVLKYTGKLPNQFQKAEFYKIVEDFPIEFWSEMPWTSDGKELWNYLISNYNNVKILSTPAAPWKKTYNKSIIGKNIWIKEKLGLSMDKIILSDRKEQFVMSNKDVLIDDRINNITKWKNSGGIGILHTSTSDTINQLKTYDSTDSRG